MDLGLQDKVAVVLAASKGMGRAAALALAQEGCRVAICARQGQALEESADAIQAATGAAVLRMAVDVTSAADRAAFLEAVRQRWGGPDILVNNCGGPKPGGLEATGDPADWEAAFRSSLMQVVSWTQAVLPTLRQRRWGRIVNIVSTSVKEPIDGLLLSNSIRPGVVGFTKSAARELAGEGVTINCVLPGSIRTDRMLQLSEAAAGKEGVTVEEILRRRAAAIPAGRLGEPAEIGAVVAFLCSRQAAYITGTTVTVDGGMTRALA